MVGNGAPPWAPHAIVGKGMPPWMHPMIVGIPPAAPASARGMQSTIGTVGTGQLTPGIVAGKQDENGIVGKAASAASPSAASAGRQSDTGIVIIGQLTPGIVAIHETGSGILFPRLPREADNSRREASSAADN